MERFNFLIFSLWITKCLCSRSCMTGRWPSVWPDGHIIFSIFCKIGSFFLCEILQKPSKKCQRFLKYCHFVEIPSNLITLVPFRKVSEITRVRFPSTEREAGNKTESLCFFSYIAFYLFPNVKLYDQFVHLPKVPFRRAA